ncbi:MAG: hypothetical protein ACP5GX_09125 [Anaerolineae bacterium]
MVKRSVKFLPPAQTQQMRKLAKRAQLSLSRFAGMEVQYNAVGLQLLDEWIERHVRQFPNPSQDVMTLWGAFLGEVFRERFNGEWAVDQSTQKPRLGVLCPCKDSGLIFIEIMEQIRRRINEGMSESLTYYYTLKGIELKSE